MAHIIADSLGWILAHQPEFWKAVGQHMALSGAALAVAFALALPIGLVLARTPRWAEAAIGVAGIARTVPGLAILALSMPILGIGFLPCWFALTILAVPPILINTVVGIRLVEPEAVDAATGMGMTRGQVMLRVELPLALPLISAGLRTAAVQTVSGATLATFIGGGGLGDFITIGISMMNSGRLLVGAVPVALLAIGTELIFGGIELWFTRHARRA